MNAEGSPGRGTAVIGDTTLLDRELSWVEFNRRVLDQALRPEVPLLERLRFLSIVSSNFDEFFMVRVAALKRGMTAAAADRQRFARLAAAAHSVVEVQYRTLHAEILPQLKSAGVRIVPAAALDPDQQRAAAADFRYRIFPALASTRLAGGAAAVAGLRLHLAFRLERETASATELAGAPVPHEEDEPPVALVAVPSGLDRLRPLPGARGEECFLLIEESIVLHGAELFPGTGWATMRCFGLPAMPTWRLTRRPTRTSSRRWRRSWSSAAPAVWYVWKSIRLRPRCARCSAPTWEWPRKTCTPSRRSTSPA